MRTSTPQLLAALLVGVMTIAAGRLASPLHDALGAPAPSPHLPVAVVTFEGAVGPAVDVVRAAGSGPVWVALPEGDPRLEGALADPGTLRAGEDGRIRFDGALRLPLPEAMRGLVVMDVGQLGPGTPPGTLAGRPVVLAWRDPIVGARVAVPGTAAPVDRAHVLAVAIGARAADAGLRVLPLFAAGAITTALTFLAGSVFHRRLHARTVRDAGLAALAAGLTCLAARAAGWDLPVGGLLLAGPLAGAVRLALATDETLRTFDRTLAWLGAPPADPGVATGLAALAEIAALHAPGISVAAWRKSPDGRAVLAAHVDGDGALPTLEQLPAGPMAGSGWHVEPVVDRGDVVGALGAASATGVPPDLVALLRVLAQNRELAPPLPNVGGADPYAARLGLVRAAVRRALARAERWEELLSRSRGALGVFDLRGALVTGSEAVRAIAGDGGRPPLLVAVATLTSLDEDTARSRVRAALGGEVPVRLPGRAPNEEIVLTPLGRGPTRDGVLLQVHDVAVHRRASLLGTTVLAATSTQARVGLAGLEARVARMADEPDAARRAALRDAIFADMDRLTNVLARGERLAGSGAGATELQPIFLQALVPEVVAGLGARRDRVTCGLSAAAPAVAGSPGPLGDALALLLDEVTRVGHAHVTTRTETEGLVLLVADDAGGLPAPVARRLVDSDRAQEGPASARLLVERMGGELLAIADPGRGMRFEIRLGYF